MSKKNNITEKQNETISTEEKKRLDSTRIFLIVFAAVALVGILTSLVFALVPMLKKEKSLDYLKSDLSKYVYVPASLYNGYTVNVDLPPVTDTDVEYTITELLCANKLEPEEPVVNTPGITVGVGDVANIYYRGYLLDKDGNKNYFDGGCNFTSSVHALEIGSGSFIPGFEYNLIGHNQKDYATFTKITEGFTMSGDIINLTYSVYYADGQAALAKTTLVDLSDPKLDETWGEGFSEYFNSVKGKKIGETFATGNGDDKKLTVSTSKKTENSADVDIYFDMKIDSAFRIGEGEKLVVEAYFPHNYGKEDLDGQTAYFEVYIKSVQDYEVPAYDDAFITDTLKLTAEDLASYSGDTLVAKHREYIRAELVKEYEASVEQVVEADLWKQVIAGSTFYKLPEKEVQAAYENYVAEIQSTYANGYSSYYSSVNDFARAYLELDSKADWMAVLREDAEYSIKQKLAFYYIIREANLIPNDEEYQRVYDELLGEYIQSYLDYYKITPETENYELKVETAKTEILSQYGESYWYESVMYEFAIKKLIAKANIVYAQ